MSTQFITFLEVDAHMQIIEAIGNNLADNLHLLERHLAYIFMQIKKCTHRQDALQWFECLDRIQFCLAKIVFVNGIGISDRLYTFMHDFDNKERAKEYYFGKIKTGEYTF